MKFLYWEKHIFFELLTATERFDIFLKKQRNKLSIKPSWTSKIFFQYYRRVFKALELRFQGTFHYIFRRQKWLWAGEMPHMLLNSYQKTKYSQALGTKSYSYRENGRGQGIQDFSMLRFIYYVESFRKQAFRYSLKSAEELPTWWKTLLDPGWSLSWTVSWGWENVSTWEDCKHEMMLF